MSEREQPSDRRAGPAEGLPRGEALVGRLVRLADPGPTPPAEGERRVEAAIRPLWAELVAARRRRRTALAAGLAAAAVLVVGLVLAPRVVERASTSPAVAVVERVVGEVETASPGGAAGFIDADAGASLDAGASVRTGRDGRIALRLEGGESLRLDRATRLRLASARQLELEQGGVYVDSRHAAAGFEVRTAFGVVRDVGTQFELRAASDRLLVRVREGRVALEHGGDELRVERGVALELSADGVVKRSAITPYGPTWSWAGEVAPAMAIEGRSLLAFLDWVTRETGRRVELEGSDLEVYAAETVLHGTIEGLSPSEAPMAVLPSCGLTLREREGVLVVRRLDRGGVGR